MVVIEPDRAAFRKAVEDKVLPRFESVWGQGVYQKLVAKWASEGYSLQPVQSAQVNQGPAYFKAQLSTPSASPSP